MQPNQKFTDKQFIELYNRNLNDYQIAEILNASRPEVTRRRWKLKLMPKRPNYKSNPTLNYQNKIKEHKTATKRYREKNPDKLQQIYANYNKKRLRLIDPQTKEKYNKSRRKRK